MTRIDNFALDGTPLVVGAKQACVMLNCGITRLYELINAGELESFRDGKARKITTRSICARTARLLAAECVQAKRGVTTAA